MRWSWIAAGVLVAALLRLASGRPESAHKRHPEPVRAEQAARAAPPRETPPPLTPEPSGPSILSLLEIGPAEVTEDVDTAAKKAPPEPPGLTTDSTASAAEEAAKKAQRRQDRMAFRAVLAAVKTAVAGCSKQQQARNPRLRGTGNVEVTVGSRTGTDRGALLEVGFDSSSVYAPLFDHCVRTALAAATFPKPASQVQLLYSYTLGHSDTSEDDDDLDDDDFAADSADESEAREQTS